MTNKIYSSVKLPKEALDLLKDEDIELEMHDELTTPSEKELLEKSKDVDALITGVNVSITSKIIQANKNLKIIANIGAGVNNIDNESAKENDVYLTNTPSRDSVASTAELALTLMLSLSRGVLKNQELVKNNEFKGWQVMGFLGENQVSYKNLFIVGLGNIGKEIARMAKAFNMNVSYYDIKDRSEFKDIEKEIGVEYVDFEEGLKNADYVILQMNYTEDNHHLIGEKELNMMKESSYLINTARGGIVDEKALVKALKDKKIKGAALDVHEEEPKINEDLIGLSNVVLTPHIGNDTYEARIEMAKVAVSEALRALKGEDLKYLVE
ncbi:MAG: NAD(P)-dependent oxidoreductase [Tissierellia bacterium]|nr:NAD(P)-dependent oxidoreductase [Tissierellia bacterium]